VRFHLVDRILECEPGVSVRGRKVCSLAEDFWEGAPGEERMPPPLVLEAFCQAGTWLVMITTERRKRAALLSIESVDFLGDVRPGDVLELIGTVESMGDEVAVLSGRAEAGDGRVVLEVRDVMCALIDADTLADLDDTERLQKMLTKEEA
jgi:3-hydroxyacyl-[acyl-carrier-protein] dehydratase